MATVIAQRGLAALSLAIGHARGGGTTAARNVVVPRVHHARCFTRRSGVAMRGWRMGEGGGAEGNDESEAESTSPWDTGGARAGGRGNRGGNARDSEPRAPSRRYADDEPGDYGSFDDDDGFDSRSSRGGGYDRRPRGGGGRGGRGRGRGGGMRGRGATRGRGRRDSAYADDDDSSSSTGYDDDDVDADGRTRWQSRHDEKKANRRESGVLTLAERLVGEAVYGRNPVLAMLGADRRDVSGIWIQEGSDASRDKALLKAAAARGITPEYASKHDLNMLTGGGSRPHNGVVADASPLTPTPMDSLPLPDGYTPGVGTPPVWLALDEVVDPQNLGAVLRSAHFLGVSGVVVCAKNSAPLSPVASKASSGALERMDVRSVGVMPRFLSRCVEEGWDVFGTDNSADAEAVTDVKVLKPTVVVVGNEGAGLRTNVRRACNRMVRIEGGPVGHSARGPGGSGGDGTEPGEGGVVSGNDTVDSLNVSVAAGIVLHAMLTSARASE